MRAWLFALVIFGLCLAVIHPWGDYPLNDDWMYARAAKSFSDSGSLRVDLPFAPALIGQMLLAYPVIHFFGMNHAFLRGLTFVMAAVSLFCIDRLLTLAGVTWKRRLFSLIVLVVNPLFLYSATSFMTELYGFAPALVAAVVYFEYRDKGSPTAMGWIAVAVLALFSFWTRQFAATVFPAIVLTSLLTAVSVRSHQTWTSVKTWLPPVLSCGVFAAGVGAYFWWMRQPRKYGFTLAEPLGRLFHIDLAAWGVETGAALVYLTGFFLPMLVLMPRGLWRKSGAYAIGLIFVAGALATWGWLRSHAASDYVFDGWIHRQFPYLTDIIFQTGIGPITLDDVFHQADTARPQWSPQVWKVIQWALLAATSLWGFVILRIRSFRRSPATTSLAREIGLFSVLWAAISWIVTVQAYQLQVFDRYYVPIILCTAIFLPLFTTSTTTGNDAAAGLRWDYVLAGICTVALAWFSVAGVHDYFRWNDARWDLARFAFHEGISPEHLAAGYEVNGWKNFDNWEAQQGRMADNCRVNYDDFFCSDASYRIGMNGIPGYTEWKQEQPSYWLAAGPPIRLLRKDAPGAR
jgi:hypothetical protein